MKRREGFLLLGVGVCAVLVTVFVLRGASASSDAATPPAGGASTPAAATASAAPPPRAHEAGTPGVANLDERYGTSLGTDHGDTLRGETHNRHRVRDDIHAFIDDKYRDPAVREAMLNYAASEIDFIEAGTTREIAVDRADQVMRNVSCVYQRLGEASLAATKEILAMTLNTPQRFAAYGRAMDLQGGRAYLQPTGDPCA